MTRYLVAADADQIQNFLFRSSHLREVIGGSMLLTHFCENVGTNNKQNTIISVGGNFRLAFDSDAEAKRFLENLAEQFRAETGGTLTAVGPVEYQPDRPGDFSDKNKALQRTLQEAKLRRWGAEAVAHMPFMAFCASCGTEVAVHYTTPTPELPAESQVKTYLCDSCIGKAAERSAQRDRFFDAFREAIQVIIVEQDLKSDHPLRSHPLGTPRDPADNIGRLDPAQYVGYILADGNGMGKWFGASESKEMLTERSTTLEAAMWASLAEPMATLVERLEERMRVRGWLPIVPLIVGGDDLFALVPARYALDIARRIGEQFEKKLERETSGRATMGLAVIICQSHYPYALVHERGEQLLKRAKQFGKKLDVSAVTFEVIVGNELVGEKDQQGGYRSTLKPYWIGSAEKMSRTGGAGLALTVLLDQRLALKDLPGKRLAELRDLFDSAEVSEIRDDKDLARWTSRLNTLRQRIGSAKLDRALLKLGREDERGLDNIWRSVLRPDKKDPYSAHGMLDLIEMWDYAYNLDVLDIDYRPEAE